MKSCHVLWPDLSDFCSKVVLWSLTLILEEGGGRPCDQACRDWGRQIHWEVCWGRFRSRCLLPDRLQLGRHLHLDHPNQFGVRLRWPTMAIVVAPASIQLPQPTRIAGAWQVVQVPQVQVVEKVIECLGARTGVCALGMRQYSKSIQRR